MPPTIHATALLVGPAGILIRGGSGSGKSHLALALIAAAQAAGRFAALVADDRVHLLACNGRLLARTPPAIAGLVERRGVGIERVPHETGAVLALVVDLVAADAVERFPEVDTATLDGIVLPRLTMPVGAAGPGSVLAALARCDNLVHGGP